MSDKPETGATPATVTAHSGPAKFDAARSRKVLAEIEKAADRPLADSPAWRVVLEAVERPELRLPLAWAFIRLLDDRTAAPSGKSVADLLARVVDEYEKGVEPPEGSSTAHSFLRWLSGARRSRMLDVPAPARGRRPPPRRRPVASEPAELDLDDDDELLAFDELEGVEVPAKPHRRAPGAAPRPTGRRESEAADPVDEAEEAVKRLRAIPFRRS